MGFRLDYTGDEVNELLGLIKKLNTDLSSYAQKENDLDNKKFRIMTHGEYEKMSNADKQNKNIIYVINDSAEFGKVIYDFKSGKNIKIDPDGTVNCTLDSEQIMTFDEFQDSIMQLKLDNKNKIPNHIDLYYGDQVISSIDVIMDWPVVHSINYIINEGAYSKNMVSTVFGDEEYKTRIEPKPGYTLDKGSGAKISITMENEDGEAVEIQNTVYNENNGFIEIDKVTGNLVITIEAAKIVEKNLIAHLGLDLSHCKHYLDLMGSEDITSLVIESLNGAEMLFAQVVAEDTTEDFTEEIEWDSSDWNVVEVYPIDRTTAILIGRHQTWDEEHKREVPVIVSIHAKGKKAPHAQVTVYVIPTGGGRYHTITNRLTNAKTDNLITEVSYGTAYSSTITADPGCDITEVQILMGGKDITDIAWK